MLANAYTYDPLSPWFQDTHALTNVIHCYHHDYDKGISMVSRYTAIGFMTYKAIQYYVYLHNMCVTLSQHYIHTH